MPAKYPELLKAVYRPADFSRPRNLLGLTTAIAVNEIKTRLPANMDPTNDALRELALQRGVTVWNYLTAPKLPWERLILEAAKAVPTEAKWRSRAKLILTTQYATK